MKRIKSMQKFIFIASCLIAGVLSFQVYQQFTQGQTKDVKATYLPAGDFTLMHNGAAFDTQSLRGTPYILYFGFTSCPDVCPLGLTVIRDALNSSERLADVKALFVTVDAERDTAEVLEQYVVFFHKNIIPLRGSRESTAAVAKQYGTYFVKVPLAGAQQPKEGEVVDPNQYTVDHTAYYFVIDQDGMLQRVLEHDVKVTELAAILESLL